MAGSSSISEFKLCHLPRPYLRYLRHHWRFYLPHQRHQTVLSSNNYLSAAQGERRPEKINNSATIFSIHAPRKLVVNQIETVKLSTKNQVNLPEGLVSTLVLLPTMRTLGLKLLKGYTVQGKQTLTFKFLNQNFTQNLQKRSWWVAYYIRWKATRDI